MIRPIWKVENCHCPKNCYYKYMDIMEKRPQIWVVTALISFIAFYLLSDFVANAGTHRVYILNELAQADLAQLSAKKSLPTAFRDLYEIEKVPTDPVTTIWADRLDLDLPVNPKGQYKLEVLVLQEESEHLTAILQYHLIHRPSGNSVWELARQYKLYND